MANDRLPLDGRPRNGTSIWSIPMKIVINKDYGGFGLSDQAIERFFQLKEWKLIRKTTSLGLTLFYKDDIQEENCFWEMDLCRADPTLVEVVEELGEKANSRYSTLKVVEIPDDVRWEIAEYDGMEHVAEKHRTWC